MQCIAQRSQEMHVCSLRISGDDELYWEVHGRENVFSLNDTFFPLTVLFDKTDNDVLPLESKSYSLPVTFSEKSTALYQEQHKSDVSRVGTAACHISCLLDFLSHRNTNGQTMAGKPAGFLQGPAVVETDRPNVLRLLGLTGSDRETPYLLPPSSKMSPFIL